MSAVDFGRVYNARTAKQFNRELLRRGGNDGHALTIRQSVTGPGTSSIFCKILRQGDAITSVILGHFDRIAVFLGPFFQEGEALLVGG